MEYSANIHHHHHHHQQQQHHHQLQDHQHVVTNPSCYAAGSTHPWTPNTILNTGGFNACTDEGIFNNPRDSWQQNNMQLSSSVNSSMTQDSSSFYWDNNTSQNFHLRRIKNESSDTSCSKLNQVLQSSPSQEIEELYTNFMKSEQRDLLNLNAKHCSEDSNSALNSSVRSFSQILPTINFSNLNQMSTFGSVEVNMQALDLFNSARFNEGFAQISRNQLGSFKGGVSYGLDHLQQTSLRPLSSPNIISSLSNVVAEAKRSSIVLESKPASQPASKKSRTESRASCPPFKVRKEKLGDRIAALQQLVAPFGKTDTASVLMEAIGYIKFLQNQVETLSVPYMNPSRNKTRVMQVVAAGNESEDPKRDNLRSRGLCLVPLSCLSYVTGDNGGGFWPPPTFGGGL